MTTTPSSFRLAKRSLPSVVCSTICPLGRLSLGDFNSTGGGGWVSLLGETGRVAWWMWRWRGKMVTSLMAMLLSVAAAAEEEKGRES